MPPKQPAAGAVPGSRYASVAAVETLCSLLDPAPSPSTHHGADAALGSGAGGREPGRCTPARASSSHWRVARTNLPPRIAFFAHEVFQSPAIARARGGGLGICSTAAMKTEDHPGPPSSAPVPFRSAWNLGAGDGLHVPGITA